jgi:hypothetical protein
MLYNRFRLAGPNPMIIQKCTQDILNKMTALPQYTELAKQVKAAYDKQELYAIDLHELKDIADSTVSTTIYSCHCHISNCHDSNCL